MYNFLCVSIFIFILHSTLVKCNLTFNNLQEKLVLQLFGVLPNTSVVASSLMVRLPLCKLASVATDDARIELMTILGYEDVETLDDCYNKVREDLAEMSRADLTSLNRLYVNYSDDIDEKFVANSSSTFGVQVDKVGFNFPKAALAYINNMISTRTFRRIQDVLDENDINKNTTMIIINAAHFKGTFEFPFDIRMSKSMEFHHIDGRRSRVVMMSKVDYFNVYEDGSCIIFSMKFRSARSSLTFVVPFTTTGLHGLLYKMKEDPNFVNKLYKSTRESFIKIYIPRIKIKTFVDWTGFLQELGLYSVFNSNSSGLERILRVKTPDNRFFLNKIKQKVFIQIEEMGIARSPINPNKDQIRSQFPADADGIPKFIVDRPFFFQVTLDYDKSSRTEVFSGVYYGPEPDVS